MEINSAIYLILGVYGYIKFMISIKRFKAYMKLQNNITFSKKNYMLDLPVGLTAIFFIIFSSDSIQSLILGVYGISLIYSFIKYIFKKELKIGKASNYIIGSYIPLSIMLIGEGISTLRLGINPVVLVLILFFSSYYIMLKVIK